jgi:photosynthetic reaction center H subunit
MTGLTGYGAVLAHFDVAQIVVYIFWGFFAALIFYLRREDHREGYPLVADYPGTDAREFPLMPPPKTFLLGDGHVVHAPRPEAPEVYASRRSQDWAGAPFEPTGNPMIDAVGPASFANRADHPELAYDDGLPKIVPLRTATDFFLSYEDPDPTGFTVLGDDGKVAGTIVDAWIDRSEYIVRYLEVETTPALGGRRVLLPMHFTRVRAKQRQIKVKSLHAKHFADVPALKDPDTVTSREEDRITGYYAGGLFYATPARSAPLL